MRGSIEEVLNELGWNNGFRIPVANEENRKLEEEIDRKIKQKKNLVEDLAINEDRVKSIEEYISNVKIEHNHNQKLLTAYAAQYNAEEHIFKMSEHEESSIAQEMRNLEKEKRNFQERISFLKKEIEKLEEKFNNSEKTVAFDKHKLLQWEEVLNKDEEDEELLEKYVKSDAKEFKNLELKRQKLSQEMETTKTKVIRTINEICEMEIILEKTSNFYVQSLEERGNLISRWSQSVQILHQRDSSIQEILQELENLKEMGKSHLKMFSEVDNFLENQISENEKISEFSKNLEKKLFFTKSEFKKIIESNKYYELEYNNKKKMLEEISKKFEKATNLKKSKKNFIKKKNKKLENLIEEIGEIKESINEIDDQNISVSERLRKLEKMLKNEEKRKFLIFKEIKKFQNLILRISGEIKELEGVGRSLEIQRAGELKKIEVFGEWEKREGMRMIEKKKIDEKLNFEIQEIEIKLGKRIFPDDFGKKEMERKIERILELEGVLLEKLEVEKLVMGQLGNLVNDVRRIQGILKSGNDELERLKGKKMEAGASMEGGEKMLKGQKRGTEEKLVAESILELRVTQAEGIFKNIGDKLQSLEKYRLQIDSAMKERLSEIKLQKEALNLQKRLISTENQELRTSILEKTSKTKNLQYRYDSIFTGMGNDCTSSAVSTTYLKILNAQEKAELQEKGDKLDLTIRRTEQEIRSMENTLRIVNACNEKYKSALDPSNEENPSEFERKRLDEEMLNSLEIMKSKKIELERLELEFQVIQEDLERVLEEVKVVKEEKELKLRGLGSLERQIGEQKERIFRADKSLRRVYKDVQRICESSGDDGVLLQERDIATRELQEQNYLALQRITEFTIRHVEAEVYVKKLLIAKNIVLPCVQHLKPSPTPSLCESTRSSLTSSGRSRLTSMRESASRIQTISAGLVFEVAGGSKSSSTTQQSPVNLQK